MADCRELKAQERRKRIRKYIRQGMKEVEMAQKEKVDVATISGDISIIIQENASRLIMNKDLIDKDLDNIAKALQVLQDIDEECWKIYYGTTKSSIPGTIGNIITETPLDAQTKLQALDKIKQNNLDRAKLLKLLNPTQINIEKLVYVEKMIPVMINKVVSIVLDYVSDKQKQVELLEKLKTINIEELEDGK